MGKCSVDDVFSELGSDTVGSGGCEPELKYSYLVFVIVISLLLLVLLILLIAVCCLVRRVRKYR